MWFAKSRQKFVSDGLLVQFINEFGDTPGILDAQEDGGIVIVFFDNRKLPKRSLPPHYYGHPLFLYDVRKMLKDAEHIVAKIRASDKIDLTNKKNQGVYQQFIHTINLCKKLLKRRGTRGAVSIKA